MANWTNIQTDSLEPGKPIRSIDGIALRDNPIAIAEGAAGAPRIQTNGINNSAVTNAKLANNSVSTAKIVNSNVTAVKLATGGAENSWVMTRYANGSSAGGVGTYAMVMSNRGTATIVWGETQSGGQLTISNNEGEFSSPLSGTWRILGSSTQFNSRTAVIALRIS